MENHTEVISFFTTLFELILTKRNTVELEGLSKVDRYYLNNLLANISSDHIQNSNVSNLSYCSNNMQNDNMWKNGIQDLNFMLSTVSNFFAQPSTYEIFKVIKKFFLEDNYKMEESIVNSKFNYIQYMPTANPHITDSIIKAFYSCTINKLLVSIYSIWHQNYDKYIKQRNESTNLLFKFHMITSKHNMDYYKPNIHRAGTGDEFNSNTILSALIMPPFPSTDYQQYNELYTFLKSYVTVLEDEQKLLNKIPKPKAVVQQDDSNDCQIKYNKLFSSYMKKDKQQEGSIELDDWWGAKSVFIKEGSFLFNLKYNILKQLLEDKVICEEDCINSRNIIPHMEITTQMNPKDKTKYNMWDNKKIDMFDFIYFDNYVKIDFEGVHFTIIYKKKLLDKVDNVKAVCDMEKTKLFKTKDIKEKVKREPIPSAVRSALWKDYFGQSTKGKCMCCQREDISKDNFDAGHIISVKDGGENHLSNLKPICGNCNKSMGTKNMDEFIKKHGFDVVIPKVETKNPLLLEEDDDNDVEQYLTLMKHDDLKPICKSIGIRVSYSNKKECITAITTHMNSKNKTDLVDICKTKSLNVSGTKPKLILSIIKSATV
jgi:5-methylcytosine-specific restriction endonuclease McrA